MKRFLAFALLAVMILAFCGCGQKKQTAAPSYEDDPSGTYFAGSDYQFMQTNLSTMYWADVQQGDGVVYLLHRGYIYYLDEGTGLILPLCNKPNCLHDKELDAEKLGECNAFVWSHKIDDENPNANGGAIAYCNGYLYCVPDGSWLYRIAADGSSKEVIYTWPEGTEIMCWLVHRGVLYCSTKTYVVSEDGTVRAHLEISALDLGSRAPRPKTIFDGDDSGPAGYTVSNLGSNLAAYGDFVYFDFLGLLEHDEGYSDETAINYQHIAEYVYGIESGECKELQYPIDNVTTIPQSPFFWRGKLLMKPWVYGAGDDQRVPVYISDLDGSNSEVLMEISLGQRIQSDGKYLYIYRLGADIESGGSTCDIFGENLEKVDSITIPEYYHRELAYGNGAQGVSVFEYGDEGYAFRLYGIYFNAPESMTAWGVLVWDKSKIGSINGEIEFTEIRR